MPLTYEQTTEIIGIANENLQNNVTQYNNIVEGLKEYGYNPQNIFGKNYCVKDTSSYAEAVESVAGDVLDSYLAYAEGGSRLSLVAFKTGSEYARDSYLIGTTAIGETVEQTVAPVMSSIAAMFGYAINPIIWTSAAYSDTVAFWVDAFRQIFEERHGYYVLDGYGNFYLNKAALDWSYNIFADLPTGEGDGKWYDSEGELLPLVFCHSFLYSFVTGGYPSGVMRRDVTFECSDPNVIFGLGKVLSGSSFRVRYAYYYPYPVQSTTFTITITTTDLYTDGTTRVTTNTQIGTVPSAGSEYDVELGGQWYRYCSFSNYGESVLDYGFTFPDVMGVGTVTNFPPSGLIGVTQETPTLEECDKIPGCVYPTLGGSIANSYPSWENSKINRNVDENGEEDNTLDDPFYPIVMIDPSLVPSIDSGDVSNFQTSPISLPDVSDKFPFVSPDFIQDLLKGIDDDVSERGPGDGTNPDVPTGVNAGITPLPSTSVPDDSGQDSGFMALYHPTKTIVRTFNNWLWSVGFDLDTFKKMFQDPMSAIISLHEIFVHPTDSGSTTIQLGYIDSNINCMYVSESTYTLDCGTLKIPTYYDNALDYEPYTDFDIYLPFIGFRKLQASDIIGNNVSVIYNIDLITGTCVADIIVDRGNFRSVMYQFTGNCAVQIPISSGNFTNILSNAIGIAASGAATLASGGSLAPMLIGATSNALTNSRAQVERGGQLGGNAGALTYKKPFIIATRQKSVVPLDYQKFSGFPASSQIRLGRCEGYTRVKDCHLDDMQATDREKQELENLLKSGIIM